MSEQNPCYQCYWLTIVPDNVYTINGFENLYNSKHLWGLGINKGWHSLKRWWRIWLAQYDVTIYHCPLNRHKISCALFCCGYVIGVSWIMVSPPPHPPPTPPPPPITTPPPPPPPPHHHPPPPPRTDISRWCVCNELPVAPFHKHGLTLILARMINHIHKKCGMKLLIHS